MTKARSPVGAAAELYLSLEEAAAGRAPAGLYDKLACVAFAQRRAGEAEGRAEVVSGVEAFRRSVASLESLLDSLDEREWRRPALRGLHVQGLIGHLIGVESAFIAILDGDTEEADVDHVTSTDPFARAQATRESQETLDEWRTLTARTLVRASAHLPTETLCFYGVRLRLDELFVVRSFEVWIHEEDIRRAIGRPLADPDPSRLRRMADLAVALLPAGMERVGGVRDARCRLVLTGPAGGTWDVEVAGGASPSGRPAVRIVLDTAMFCRVVGNRLGGDDVKAWIEGDHRFASALLQAASTLALD